MKKSLVLLFVLLAGQAVMYAQQKGSMYGAQNNFERGLLDEAKRHIDAVMENPKKAKSLNAMLLKAKIYHAIELTDKFEYQNLHKNAGAVAGKLYAAVCVREAKYKENSPAYVEAFNGMNAIWGNYVQIGSDQYAVKNYEKAYDNFYNALEIKPDDSISLVYAGYMALLSENYDKMLLHYYRLKEIGKADMNIYRNIVQVEQYRTKNLDKALVMATEGRERFSEETFFARQELLILVEKKEIQKAEKHMEAVLKATPNDIELLLQIAALYDDTARKYFKEKNFEEGDVYVGKAVSYYKKTLKVKPDDLAANFNIASLYVTKADRFYKELRNLSNEEYELRGEELANKGNAIVSDALPYLEHAHKVSPNDIEILSVLQQVSYQLGHKKKAEQYKQKLKALETEQAAASDEGR